MQRLERRTAGNSGAEDKDGSGEKACGRLVWLSGLHLQLLIPPSLWMVRFFREDIYTPTLSTYIYDTIPKYFEGGGESECGDLGFVTHAAILGAESTPLTT